MANNGTQISDMTPVAFDDAPEDATLPWVVETTGGGYSNQVNYRTSLVGPIRERPTSAVLADDAGASLIGSNDGQSGSLWTTVAGFISYLLSTAGSNIVGFLQAGTGAVARTAQAKMREMVSVKDFGAIGDGTSHPVSEWVPSRFANLAAIQAVYPDVTSLTNQIDFAAINAAVRYASANGKGVFIPAGVYLAWVYAWYSNVFIQGAGSSCTTIKVPNGATHTIPDNNSGGGPFVTGVPCVVDFNCIGKSNFAPALSNGALYGVTLDGNATGTTVPTSDLFGWGVSSTNYSYIDFGDVQVINTHCGGSGTFINSNYHSGNIKVRNCGNSVVDGAKRPGFDYNSSKYGVMSFISEDCAYGGRLLDNCNNNVITGVVKNATLTGFLIGNQVVNPGCWANKVDITVEGGCSDYGITLGANVFGNDISILTNQITGAAYRDVEQVSASNNATANRIRVNSRLSGGSAAVIYAQNNDFDIISDRDCRSGSLASNYAIDVYGDGNRIHARIFDTSTPQTNGVNFRSTAAGNVVEQLFVTNVGTPYTDAGSGNYRMDIPAARTTLTLINGFSEIIGGTYSTPTYYKGRSGRVYLTGHPGGVAAGTACATLPVGFRPLKNILFSVATSLGASRLQVGSDGTIVPLDTSPSTSPAWWSLDGIEFDTLL